MSRRDDDRHKRTVSPTADSDRGRKRQRYDGERPDRGPSRDPWHEESYRDLAREDHRLLNGYSPRRSPTKRRSPRRDDSHRGPGMHDAYMSEQRPLPQLPQAPGGFPPAMMGRGRMGPPSLSGSFRGRGNFQAFVAGGRGAHEAGGSFRGRGGRGAQGRGPFMEGFRGRGARWRGGRYDVQEFGRRGRGFILRPPGPPPFTGPPAPPPPGLPGAPPAVDPARVERRKKNVARLLGRQLALVELNPDLVDEPLYDRFLELKAAQGTEAERDSPVQLRIEDMFMWDCLGSTDGLQDAQADQRYDQSEAFEYCLQLYQSVSEIRPSKFGHYIV